MMLATHQDKPLLVHLLSQAFAANGSVNYVVGDGDGQLKRIRALMEYSIELCFRFGNVYLDEDRAACALVLYPHRKRRTLKSVALDAQLAFRAIGLHRICRVLRREEQIKKIQPKEDMAYLWFIGVDPARQHAGIGSTLLQSVIDVASRDGLPVYLETSVTENLPWYQRFGFTIYGSLDMGSHTLYFMRRMPAKMGG
ncbi:MAG TPA: GNAT family N-acetyltransferase [Parapedobacter sp.]|uniref:GNAT family N-acetyltransferase n=1 Tax=Parapedobacter sp. TaxID=1958893 RepID=UPI002C80336A|nr:GNAT family N-acetyltransferase [Parapedobacter sp.]HWK55742.1 GNAT family N-acetyltransferase [Parapedobacter sp.]